MTSEQMNGLRPQPARSQQFMLRPLEGNVTVYWNPDTDAFILKMPSETINTEKQLLCVEHFWEYICILKLSLV